VDFSGARLAGRHAWLARIERNARDDAPAPYKLTWLARLDALCGVPEREPVLAHLVSQIAASHSALWALGFPFGLPLEVQPEAATGGWPASGRVARPVVAARDGNKEAQHPLCFLRSGIR